MCANILRHQNVCGKTLGKIRPYQSRLRQVLFFTQSFQKGFCLEHKQNHMTERRTCKHLRTHLRTHSAFLLSSRPDKGCFVLKEENPPEAGNTFVRELTEVCNAQRLLLSSKIGVEFGWAKILRKDKGFPTSLPAKTTECKS